MQHNQFQWHFSKNLTQNIIHQETMYMYSSQILWKTDQRVQGKTVITFLHINLHGDQIVQVFCKSRSTDIGHTLQKEKIFCILSNLAEYNAEETLKHG